MAYANGTTQPDPDPAPAPEPTTLTRGSGTIWPQDGAL
jgi:hypothetical protein